MPKQPLDWQRKNEHIFLSEKFYQESNSEFNQLQILAKSIPDTSTSQINIQFQWQDQLPIMSAPIYINAMTGGAPQVTEVNSQLSKVAKALNIPLAVGSMSNYLRYPQEMIIKNSYQIVRQNNPHGLLFANVSAQTPWAKAQQAVDLIQADFLQVHLNAAQEIVMSEGEVDFNWSQNLQTIIQNVNVPVIIKEVGCGMTSQTVQHLQDLGATIIDISGRGGTNFVQIENERNHSLDYSFLNDWGLTTLESLIDIEPQNLPITILASGGIRTPLDAIKCLILGAKAVGIAAPVLHSLKHQGLQQTIINGQKWLQQFTDLMTLLGCHNLQQLSQINYRFKGDLWSFYQQKYCTKKAGK
ncbi:type 2 isopentenyl-diphosphate Delta-isomerase [Bombilactobacillus folatiphilus]|uniref:Isopentenyl-diphosphate delta-isomerase n=1 Tax=Bombilactobacillus folatiphilus TaxID=2923362 RepID=A0ABY4P786_9LACO|nr:type 2 isopentenyl-diphosphate Delta-isomerase [Bombilactobacillus folatiphilus]UQS81503.1 type 2 isopentenyl-diphosphate Delta-isomerase [Bombilactobacillus folatiphilus]